LNASGGTEKNTYFISGSYYKSDATTKGIDYDKATFRVNVNSELTKKLTLKAGFSGSFQRTSNFLGGSFFANPIRAMYRLAPWLPVYKAMVQLMSWVIIVDIILLQLLKRLIEMQKPIIFPLILLQNMKLQKA
jgi:hypothetical protein